jgi:hypothetical protein
MATIALDIRGPGSAVQSFQGRVQQLTDVVVRHLARFRRIAQHLLGNIANAEGTVQDAFLAAFTPGSVQRTSEDVHVAHGHRDQCRSHEYASTLIARDLRCRRERCRRTRRRGNTTLACLA